MLIVGILISVIILGLLIRMALSKQSEKPLKLAAIIALGLIALSVIICLIMIFAGPAAEEEEEVFAGLPLAEPVQVSNPNGVYILLFGVLLLLFLGLIIFLSLREQKKGKNI
jgi:amino acid transporter